MLSRYYRPRPPLANYVDVFWLYEGYRQAHAMERFLPTGTMQVIVNLRADSFRVYDNDQGDGRRMTTIRGPLIAGPRDEYTFVDTEQQEALLGIQFKPGGALPFLAVPMSEVHNRDVGLEALWGTAARELHERVGGARSAQARFEIVEEALLARLACSGRRYVEPHPAVAFALHEFHASPRTRTIAEVVERVGLSRRRFIQVFSETVGLTPKAYRRVWRFQATLQRISSAESVAWAEVAASCGYYDQAHFIHDFRAFSGLAPSAYLAQRGEHRNHVPLSV